MIIAISGASGFIGTELVKYHLKCGDEVRILSRRSTSPIKGIKLFTADLNAPLEKLFPFLNDVDTFYHCAAEITNEEAMYSTNVLGTANMLKVAAQAKIQTWVQLSSTGVYGFQPHAIITEESAPAPESHYEKTKLLADELVLDASDNNIFRTVILRPSNVFGQNMTNTSLFSLIQMINKGMFFFIGDRQVVANYVHVDNVIHALQLVALNNDLKSGSIFIISDSCKLEQLVAAVCKALDLNIPRLRIPERPLRHIVSLFEKVHIRIPLSTSRINALTQSMTFSSQRICDELGYNTIVPLQIGIKDLALSTVSRTSRKFR